MARDTPDRSKWPSLAETHASGMTIAGVCSTCRPPRRILVDMPTAIERYGADTKTRDVMDRITCSVCGAKVSVTLTPGGMGAWGRAGRSIASGSGI